VLLLVVGIEPICRHSGSIIMSAVYSYDAARRNDSLIELVKQALDLVLQELRPEIAAIFGAFPFRGSSLPLASIPYRRICSSSPPVVVSRYAPQENCTLR